VRSLAMLFPSCFDGGATGQPPHMLDTLRHAPAVPHSIRAFYR